MTVQTAVDRTSKLLILQQENAWHVGLVQIAEMVVDYLFHVVQLYLLAQKFIVFYVSVVQISRTAIVLINVNLVECVQGNMNMYSTNAPVKMMSSVIAMQGFIGTKQVTNVFPVVPAQAA